MAIPDQKLMGWGTIVAILVVEALVVGMALGLAGDLVGRNLSLGVGVAVGVTGAFLVGRRRAALAAARNDRKVGT